MWGLHHYFNGCGKDKQLVLTFGLLCGNIRGNAVRSI